MNDIICPNCKKAFKVDEAGFADILKQVRDQQFETEIKQRLEVAEKDKNNAVQIAEAKLKNELQLEFSKKELVDFRLFAIISLPKRSEWTCMNLVSSKSRLILKLYLRRFALIK